MHEDRSMVYNAFMVSWPYKDNGICFSVQCCSIANKKKEDISFFLYSKCMEVDQCCIARLSSFGLTSIQVYFFLANAVSFRIWKKEAFLFSLFEKY